MKKILLTISIIIISVILFWYWNTSQYKPLEDTIIIGTSADFPPFSFRDQNDQIVGFDIDIAKEVARRIGMNTNFLDRPFALLLPQIQIGQIHMIAAGMTPTEERSKMVNFTKPYLSGNPIIILSLSKFPKITSLEDLKDKELIVNTGYTADLYFSKFPDLKLIRLPNIAESFAALEQEKGYAFATAEFTVRPYLKKYGNNNKFNIFRLLETDESNALGVSKKLPQEFFDKVQKALDEMEADGTLLALKQKWEVV